MKLRTLIERDNVRADVRWTDHNPHMENQDWPARHYVVRLKRQRRQMAVPFSCGLGIEGEPTAADVLDCLLSDYYTAAYGRVVFHKSLRDHMVFSDHSLATDSVFSEVHLVSCRNVLIYFNKKLQDRALGLFHESLSHRGFLGLGSKESLRFSAHTDAFEDFVPLQRIYRKKSSA